MSNTKTLCLKNFFGLNIMPWRPPLDVLYEKIRPTIETLVDRMGGILFEFHTYRGVDGTVYAEVHHAAKPKKVNMKPPRLRSVVRFVDNWNPQVIDSWTFDRLFKPVRSGNTLDMHDSLSKAARNWWLKKRPYGWNLRQHLQNPTVNCKTANDATLASAVARIEFAKSYKRVSNTFIA